MDSKGRCERENTKSLRTNDRDVTRTVYDEVRVDRASELGWHHRCCADRMVYEIGGEKIQLSGKAKGNDR